VTATDEPVVRDNRSADRFEILVDGTVVGWLTYRRSGDRLTAIHTEVDEAYAGRGLATRLVASALEMIRDEGLTVRPSCPFVAAYLDKHRDDEPGYRDIVEAV
jgi:uncharacterized protein